jgi:hypothetical protein
MHFARPPPLEHPLLPSTHRQARRFLQLHGPEELVPLLPLPSPHQSALPYALISLPLLPPLSLTLSPIPWVLTSAPWLLWGIPSWDQQAFILGL